jgi:hypothetical protein
MPLAQPSLTWSKFPHNAALHTHTPFSPNTQLVPSAAHTTAHFPSRHLLHFTTLCLAASLTAPAGRAGTAVNLSDSPRNNNKHDVSLCPPPPQIYHLSLSLGQSQRVHQAAAALRCTSVITGPTWTHQFSYAASWLSQTYNTATREVVKRGWCCGGEAVMFGQWFPTFRRMKVLLSFETSGKDTATNLRRPQCATDGVLTSCRGLPMCTAVQTTLVFTDIVSGYTRFQFAPHPSPCIVRAAAIFTERHRTIVPALTSTFYPQQQAH